MGQVALDEPNGPFCVQDIPRLPPAPKGPAAVSVPLRKGRELPTWQEDGFVHMSTANISRFPPLTLTQLTEVLQALTH